MIRQTGEQQLERGLEESRFVDTGEDYHFVYLQEIDGSRNSCPKGCGDGVMMKGMLLAVTCGRLFGLTGDDVQVAVTGQLISQHHGKRGQSRNAIARWKVFDQ